jgi:hypothetical protein
MPLKEMGLWDAVTFKSSDPTNPTDAIQKWARNSEKAIAAIDLTLEYSITVLVKWFATHLRTDRQRCWV